MSTLLASSTQRRSHCYISPEHFLNSLFGERMHCCRYHIKMFVAVLTLCRDSSFCRLLFLCCLIGVRHDTRPILLRSPCPRQLPPSPIPGSLCCKALTCSANPRTIGSKCNQELCNDRSYYANGIFVGLIYRRYRYANMLIDALNLLDPNVTLSTSCTLSK